MTAAIAEVPKAKTAPPQVAPVHMIVQEIPIHLIVRSETNRKPEVDEGFIESISRGVNSPVLVRPIKAAQGHLEQWRRLDAAPVVLGQTIYKLVYGERRWIASDKAGKKTIPAIVRELTDTQALEIQIEENEHREDYAVMDRAAAYAHLRAQYMLVHKGEKGWTEEKCCDLIAEKCKNDKIKGRTVQQIIALGKLHTFCQAALRQGEMEQSHAYEISRRPEEEQLELLKWIRQQTQHSQGDIPSVRRLKLEIRSMDIAADDKRRQEKLFKEGPGASAKLTFDGKTIDLAPGPLPGSVRTALLKTYPDLSTTAHFLQDGRVQLARGLTGKPFYVTVEQLQGLLSAGVLRGLDPAQTSAPDFHRKDGKIGDEKLHGDAKPPSKRHLKAEAEQREQDAKLREQAQKEQRESVRKALIDLRFEAVFFDALASKAMINSRLLTHVVPALIFELWENRLPIEAFAQNVLGWPAPESGEYTYSEVRSHTVKHTRKFSPGLLAALLIISHLEPDKAERLAKYFHVDAKKLRLKAAAEVKAERLRVPEPKTPKDKVLFSLLDSRDKDWAKLRKNGATDKQIRELLCARFGEYGGTHAPNEPSIVYRGTANNPRVWFKMSDSGAPDFAGTNLVEKVRELLNISEEGAA